MLFKLARGERKAIIFASPKKEKPNLLDLTYVKTFTTGEIILTLELLQKESKKEKGSKNLSLGTKLLNQTRLKSILKYISGNCILF